jgi:hypothetical protein
MLSDVWRVEYAVGTTLVQHGAESKPRSFPPSIRCLAAAEATLMGCIHILSLHCKGMSSNLVTQHKYEPLLRMGREGAAT